eukprot:9118401-Alexandrium_andersonii.AAC.1
MQVTCGAPYPMAPLRGEARLVKSKSVTARPGILERLRTLCTPSQIFATPCKALGAMGLSRPC